MRGAKIEFYGTGPNSLYFWRLRDKKGQIILSSYGSPSHRDAVASFKRIATALNARGPWEIRDLEGVTGSHAMLIR